MIQNLLQVCFTTHRVHVSRDDETNQILCFKYDGSACDFNTFSPGEDADAADWMMQSIPTYSYSVFVLGDQE
jgi:hypothetical protein